MPALMTVTGSTASCKETAKPGMMLVACTVADARPDVPGLSWGVRY